MDSIDRVKNIPAVHRFLDRVQSDDAILAVLLFGSHARGEASPSSDIDLSIVLDPSKDSADERRRLRLAYLPDHNLDIRLFQQLPLYIRKRALKEGVVLFCCDLDVLYELAYRTAKAFNDFEPHYRRYLEQVGRD